MEHSDISTILRKFCEQNLLNIIWNMMTTLLTYEQLCCTRSAMNQLFVSTANKVRIRAVLEILSATRNFKNIKVSKNMVFVLYLFITLFKESES
jgi:hypothetical protein